MKFQMIAEHAMMITFNQRPNLQVLKKRIDNNDELPIIETVIGYTTLTIYYNFRKISDKELQQKLQQLIEKEEHNTESSAPLYKIPVCYDEEFGWDLDEVINAHSISHKELVSLHTEPTYTVSFLGFSPGFPFLSGMNPTIQTSRKQTPRLEVPKGSVGIAGNQTGIYPSQSPGGWQIIGRTPLELLPLYPHKPTLLTPGDQVQFYSITKETFWQIYEEECQKHEHRDH